MKILDRTFNTPEENLACDEALLEAAEEGLSGEVLRFWSPKKPFVVLGYSNKISEDVHWAACQKKRVPVLRRISGGGTVLQGPGCLNYSLILKIADHPELSSITSTNRFVMEKNLKALQALAGPKAQIRGITDLALGDLKFSGNAQRRKRSFILFHGTFLLSFDISKIEKFLKLPPKQPDYRKNRKHSDFLANLNLTAGPIQKNLAKTWQAAGVFNFIFEEKIKKLAESSYSKKEWNFKF